MVVMDLRWHFCLFCCFLEVFGSLSPTEVWKMRLVTVVNYKANQTWVNQGVTTLATTWDVFYRNFVPPKTGKECDELKKVVESYSTMVVLTVDGSNSCQLTDASFPSQKVFVEEIVPQQNESLADVSKQWNSVLQELNENAPEAVGYITVDSAKKLLAENDQRNTYAGPTWVMAFIVILLLLAIAGLIYLLIERRKLKKKIAKFEHDASSKTSQKKRKSGSKTTSKSTSQKNDSASTKSICKRSTTETVSERNTKNGKIPTKNDKKHEEDKKEKEKEKPKSAATTTSDAPQTEKTLPEPKARSPEKAVEQTKLPTTSPKKLSSEILDSEMESDKSVRPDRSREIEVVSPPPPPRRTKENLRVDPMNSSEFTYYLGKVSKLLIEYYDDPSNYNVTPNVKPSFMFKSLPTAAPEEPEDFTAIFNDLKTTVMSGMTHWQHPRFYAYFASGRNYACMLADLITSGLATNGFSWDSCPALTEMEHVMVNWLGRALGLPELFLFQGTPESSEGGGCMFETASEAIHCSLIASRQWKIQQVAHKVVGQQIKNGILYDMDKIHEIGKKLVVYTNKDAHSSIEKGCKLAMVRCQAIAPTEKNGWGITGEQVELQVKKDISKGLIPTHIHVTLGTTSTASSDHLESICEVAKKYDIWVHVDAAYSGNFWIDPKYRINCAGLQHVHSININPHKQLLHSSGCTVFWTKNQKVYKDAFAITPVYLKPTHANATDLRDWGIQLSRRFMCLKTWIVMRVYGIKGLQIYVNKLVEMAAYFEGLVDSHPNCRLFAKRNFGCFCFQYREPGMTEEEINDCTQKLCQFMNSSHRIFLTHTKVGKHNLIRVSINYERTTKATIDESWCIIQDLMEEWRPKMKDPPSVTAVTPLPGRQDVLVPGMLDYEIAGCPTSPTNSLRSDVSPPTPLKSINSTHDLTKKTPEKKKSDAKSPKSGKGSTLSSVLQNLHLPYPLNMEIPNEGKNASDASTAKPTTGSAVQPTKPLATEQRVTFDLNKKQSPAKPKSK